MKKTYALIAALFLFSCKKDVAPTSAPEIASSITKQQQQVLFSKALAKTLQQEPSVRALIKAEALKEFDKDFDVLFQMVMHTPLADGGTLYQKILNNGITQDQLDQVLAAVPTLTIMVPEVPNFSAETWNTATDIPVVAVAPEKDTKPVKLYKADGEAIDVPEGAVPGIPVVVVKENERVNATVQGASKAPQSAALLASTDGTTPTTFYNKQGVQFTFSNEAFNGLPEAKDKHATTISRYVTKDARTGIYDIDEKAIASFDNQLEWQRDYIYYDINPAAGTTRGKFNIHYQEYIKSIKMKASDYSGIGDQAEDPVPTKAPYAVPRPGSTPTQAQLWTDGSYEIRINVLINAKNGVGSVLNKVIHARGNDLYIANYTQTGQQSIFYYVGVTPKEFIIDEPLVPWDLAKYGDTWKFSCSEYDTSDEVTTMKSNTSTFATNFELNVSTGDTDKIGTKFGMSTTEQIVNQYTYKSSLTSDELGDGILEFGQPVIVRSEQYSDRGITKTRYVTYEVSTGAMTLSIEPKRYF